MPRAQLSDIHKNAALSNISIMFKNADLIGEMAIPVVNVSKKNDFYYVYGTENFDLEETVKAEKGVANKVTYTVTTGNYYCVAHALEDVVTPSEMRNADAPLDPFVDATEMITDRILLRKEQEVADVLFGTGNYAVGLKTTTGLPAWNASSGNVINQIASARDQVILNSGKKPNQLALGSTTYLGLQTNTILLERIKYVQGGVITADIMGGLFEVDKVLVGRAVKDSANEGQTASNTRIWSDFAALTYQETSPGIRKPSFSYIFQDVPRATEVRAADEIEKGAQWVRVVDSYDVKLVSNKCGYIFANCSQ